MDRLIFLLTLGTFMASIDATIVVLALPIISEELSSPLFLTSWIIILYTLVIAVFTTQLGRIGDIYGRAKMYNLGFMIFTIGSALCGFSINIFMLLASRVIQAIGGALLQANSGAIIADNYPRQRIGRPFGYLALGWNLGATAGVFLGGLITTLLGWRFIFFINIPVGVVATTLGFKVLKDKNKVNAKLDILGASLLLISLTLYSLSSSYITVEGISLSNVILIILGTIFLLLFILTERTAESPLIDLRVFKNRVLSASLFASLFQSLGAISISFLFTLYLQGIRGFTPLYTSLILSPSYILASIFSPIAGRLTDKYGARVIATLGLSIMLVAVVCYILLLTPDTSILLIALVSSLIGVGSSLFYPANNSAIMGNARAEYYGSISGMLRTLGNIGILGSYALSISISSLTIPRNIALSVFSGSVSLGGLPIEYISGIRDSLIVSVGIIVVAIILSLIRGKEERLSARSDFNH
ncbi:MAG: MFS transporter [Ignisphaera sp.]